MIWILFCENFVKYSWNKACLLIKCICNAFIIIVVTYHVILFSRERLWKWEYVLNINNSIKITASLPEISFTSTVEAFKNSTSTSGKEIVLIAPSTSYIDYNKHFSMYVSSKITHNALETFKERIIQAWKSKGKNIYLYITYKCIN